MRPLSGSSHDPVDDAEVTTELWLCLCCINTHLWLYQICYSKCFALSSKVVVGTEG